VSMKVNMPVQVPRLPLAQQLRVLRVLVLLGAHAQVGRAASLSATETASIETTPTLVERTENLGRLYHSQDNPVLQDLWFLGRYHGQYYWAEGSRGADDDWENRRFRIGGQARLFQRLTVLAQMVSGTDMDPFYGGFTELWAGWRFTDAVTLTIGQQKHRFTHDRIVSSRYVNYLERAQLTQMFALDYTPAVTLSGEVGEWTYYGGLFSNVTGSDMGEAFTEFDAGGSLLGNATRNLGRSLGTDTAYLNFGLVASDANKNASNLNHFDYGLSSALILTKGSVSLVTEVTVGLDSKDGSAAGLNLQPGWFLTDTTQLVARYQLSASDDERGLRAQKRYERAAGMTAGDLYQAAYLGLNRYIVGHRLKLMSGVEYATLGGEDCWTASVAVRLFWGPQSRGPFPMAQTLPGTWR
jgi:phosphate-selective porin OprO/OprP